MNGTFASNLKQGAAIINAAAAELVTYRRGNAATSLRMRPSNAAWPAKTVSPVIEQWTGTDWIVTPDEWANSGLGAPARGDKIDRPINGSVQTYELVAPPNEQLWNLATFGEVYLIHTQAVAT